MQDAQAFSQPARSRVLFDAHHRRLAGWIAGTVTESRHGILTNILVGIAGAFVGGELAGLLNIDVFGFFRTLISATVGAIVILFIWRKFARRRDDRICRPADTGGQFLRLRRRREVIDLTGWRGVQKPNAVLCYAMLS